MKIQGKRLTIHFVVKDKYRNENDVSDDMQLAFMVSTSFLCSFTNSSILNVSLKYFQNTVDWRLQPKWVRQSELTAIQNEKGNVFVFEEFNDEFINNFNEAHPNA